MLWASPAWSGIQLDAVQAARSTVPLFERCELTARISGSVSNPYDPSEVRLEAVFQSPQGESTTMEGFYYQPFELAGSPGQEFVRAAGEPVWKVRFTPRQIGRWGYEVRLITPQRTQTWPRQTFVVVESSRKGFIQWDRRAGTFRFETGEPFIPIGENLSWGPSHQPLRVYGQWLRELASQRANYVRVWMAPWFLRLETKETGVGRYDQSRAWLLDTLLERSESAGIFWQLCLLEHGSFSRSQDPNWHNNPYNQALGGMCRLPQDFLTHPKAKEMFQRLVRYMVSRWGYSPNLAMWELFNEADFGEFKTEELVPWLDETSRFLRSVDPYQRPITTSFHGDAPKEVWRLPMMDAIQLHVYDKRDLPGTLAGPTIPELRRTFQKPVFIGEFGWIAETMRQVDDIGIHLHDGLWSSLVGGSAGGALIWYWDSYVHPPGLYRHFDALGRFWRGETLSLQQRPMAVQLSDQDLAGWGIGTPQRGYLWIKNRRHTIDQYLAYRAELAKQRLRQARGEAATELAAYSPRLVRGATATVRGLDWVSRYRIEWWDTYRGRIAARDVVQTRWGTLTIKVPEVQFDLAAKLIKLNWWEQG
ncbi:MAG: hypothetical protein A3C53_01950 [Omnitrophica WOR_2 bacterium RIFCSPHIGHO2_02_FULL_68_15]|nr:MAG: hypothetical protein A3C53_01950 [Omnitrophica WOR_2 bacterium RIFCSPHIGHO2_02_FULL_68_15]